MFIGVKDCIICMYDKNLSMNHIAKYLTSNTFEKYSLKKLNDKILDVEFTWLDSIKIRDKIVSRKQKTIRSWIYLDMNYIVLFGSSESDVNFFKTKLQNLLGITIKELNLYSEWRWNYLHKRSWIATLTSIQLKDEITPYDEGRITSIQVNNLTLEEVKRILTERMNLIISLTFSYRKYNKITFYMDPKSVISFPDTIHLNEMIVILDEVRNEQR